MKINEVEKLLGIPIATRFYEKEHRKRRFGYPDRLLMNLTIGNRSFPVMVFGIVYFTVTAIPQEGEFSDDDSKMGQFTATCGFQRNNTDRLKEWSIITMDCILVGGWGIADYTNITA